MVFEMALTSDICLSQGFLHHTMHSECWHMFAALRNVWAASPTVYLLSQQHLFQENLKQCPHSLHMPPPVQTYWYGYQDAQGHIDTGF